MGNRKIPIAMALSVLGVLFLLYLYPVLMVQSPVAGKIAEITPLSTAIDIVPRTPLDIAITYPSPNSIVNGTIEATAIVEGKLNLDQVAALVDNSVIQIEQKPPFKFTIDTTKYADGIHSFKVTARTAGGLTNSTEIQIIIQNNAP